MAAVCSWTCAVGTIAAVVAAGALMMGVPARLLVWSAVGNCGLLLAGMGLAMGAGGEKGAQAAVFFAASLFVSQALAFLPWREMRGKAKAWDLSPERGVGRKMPAAALAFTAGALGLAGLPPSPGFFARILLFAAGLRAGGAAGYGAVVACGLQSLAWLAMGLQASSVAWLGAPPARPIRPLERRAVAGLAFLALLMALLGLVPSPLLQAGQRLAYLLGARE